MNFSPDNRATLESLLAGLAAGVGGDQAAPILNATLQAQMQQAADRKARYQEMASNVANLAGQGMTYGSVGNYIDSMTPQAGIPGKFQQLLDSAYANPDLPPGLLPSPGEPGFASTSRESPEIMSQLQSPLYTQNPASTGAYNSEILTDPSTGGMVAGPNFGDLMTAPQQALFAAQQAAMEAMPAPSEPSDADMMGQVNAQINNLKAAQMSPEEIVRRISTNPEVQGIIMSNINEFATLQPDIIGLMAPGMGI